MGIPTEPILNIMRRSMANLRFVEERCGPAGPFEVTQLINTFLGALAHPFEAMRDDLRLIPIVDAQTLGWPQISKERTTYKDPESLGDLVRLMRNGIAHGNIEFLSDGKGQIRAIRLWNTSKGSRNWGAIITIEDMRRFLDVFVDLIERRHKEFGWYARGVA